MKYAYPVNPWTVRARVQLLTAGLVGGLLIAVGGPAGANGTSAASSGSTSLRIQTTAARCPSGSASGATSKQLTVAATIIDISSGSLNNSTVGVPSVQEQKDDWNTVAHSINSSGGAGCHKIVMSFYDVNSIDTAGAQQVCLNIAAARPYIVLDTGALTDIGASNCIPAQKVPLVSDFLTQDQLTQYFPYYLMPADIPTDGARNGILGLKQLGYFSPSKGFKKLGLLYHDCTPAFVAAQQAAIKEAGISGNKLVSFNLGCPAGQNDTPASMEQAVLSFKSNNVTDVTEAGVNDFGIFSQVAQQQDFKPQYVLDDPGQIATGVKSGADAPNPSNFNSAVDVIGGGYGEQTTPGFKSSGGTKKCDAIYAAAGKPSVYKQADGYGGFTCDYLWFVQALLNNASTVQQSTLAKDMHSIGTVDFSYGAGPVDFSAAPAGKPYGISYWRPIYYHQSCTCWQVPNATFHPPFK
jgi:hypothetical protein